MEAETFKIITFTDSITECDCCGKTGLKGTYVMEGSQGGELYFGVTCGAKAVGKTTAEFKKEATVVLSKQAKNTLIDEMILTKKTEQDENKIIKFIKKNGLDLDGFLLKHGKEVDSWVVESENITLKYFSFGCYCLPVKIPIV